MASEIGACQLSADTTDGLNRSRRRTSGAATPTATAPNAAVRRAREVRKARAV